MILVFLMLSTTACYPMPYPPSKTYPMPTTPSQNFDDGSKGSNKLNCRHRFTTDQTNQQVALIAAQMHSDCGYQVDEVLKQAKKIFSSAYQEE